MAPTIEAVLNAALSIPFTFEDDFGALVTGKVDGDFAKAAYLASAPATTATPTVAAVSGQSGDYAVTVPANGLSVAGLWRVNASCLHSDGVTYRFGWNVQVETAAQADPAASVTALYGALLANLDAAVSSRATPAEVAAVQAGLLATFTAVTFTSSVDPLTSRVTIHQGDDETLPWTVTSPSLTGATAILRVFRGSTDVLTKPVAIVGTAVTATLTAVETAALSLGTPAYKYELIATLAGGGIKTLAAGDVWVRD